MKQSMLTTIDNPFNPFTDFDPWLAWDLAAGYNTLSALATLTLTSSELPPADQTADLDRAIDELATENYNGVWVKVTQDIEDSIPQPLS